MPLDIETLRLTDEEALRIINSNKKPMLQGVVQELLDAQLVKALRGVVDWYWSQDTPSLDFASEIPEQIAFALGAAGFPPPGSD